MVESMQYKLDWVCLLCVQIIYDVEIGNVIEKKELFLVVGIFVDFFGKLDILLVKLVEWCFVDIDCDNFNEIFFFIFFCVILQVDNIISGDDSKLNVELCFNYIEDFDLVNLVKQVVLLCCLFEVCQCLCDLLIKFDGNDDFDQLLQDVVVNIEGLQEIKVVCLEVEVVLVGDSEFLVDQLV